MEGARSYDAPCSGRAGACGLRHRHGCWPGSSCSASLGVARELVSDGRLSAQSAARVHQGLLGWDAGWYEAIAAARVCAEPDLDRFGSSLWSPCSSAGARRGPGCLRSELALVVSQPVCPCGSCCFSHASFAARPAMPSSRGEPHGSFAWLLLRSSSSWAMPRPRSSCSAPGRSSACARRQLVGGGGAFGPRRAGPSARRPSRRAGCDRMCEGMDQHSPGPVDNVAALDAVQPVCGSRHGDSRTARVRSLLGVRGRWRYGDAFAPLRIQEESGHRGALANPLSTLAHDASLLVHGSHLGTALHLPWVVLAVLLVVVAAMRLPASHAAFAFCILAVALTASNLDSFERYALSAFPLVVAGASLYRSPRSETTVLVLATAGLACYSMLAFTGLYVP